MAAGKSAAHSEPVMRRVAAHSSRAEAIPLRC